MTDVFMRCSKKIAAQVCIEYMGCNICQKEKGTEMACVTCIILPMLDFDTHDCSLSALYYSY